MFEFVGCITSPSLVPTPPYSYSCLQFVLQAMHGVHVEVHKHLDSSMDVELSYIIYIYNDLNSQIMKVEEDRSRTSKSRRHAIQGPAGLLAGYSCFLSRDA